MTTMLRSSTLVWLLVLCGGCGETTDTSGSTPYVRVDTDAAMGDRCEDMDGDGYGDGCTPGRDCDDADPLVTNLCFICERASEPLTGCPCGDATEEELQADPLAGTEAVCDPAEVESRETMQEGELGVLKCTEAVRYCANGVWGECIALDWAFEAY